MNVENDIFSGDLKERGNVTMENNNTGLYYQYKFCKKLLQIEYVCNIFDKKRLKLE